MSNHSPEELRRLCSAIRRFTVDVDGGRAPNGQAEWWLGMLVDALGRGELAAAQQCVEPYLTHSADDTQELREAAEAYFGGDFRAADQPPHDDAAPEEPAEAERVPRARGSIRA